MIPPILDRQHPRCRNRPSATDARLWNLALSPDVMNGAESAPASRFTSNFALPTATLSPSLFSRPPLAPESLLTTYTRSLHQRVSVRLSTLFGCHFCPSSDGERADSPFSIPVQICCSGVDCHSFTLGILLVGGFCHSSEPGASDHDKTDNFQS